MPSTKADNQQQSLGQNLRRKKQTSINMRLIFVIWANGRIKRRISFN